MSEDSCNSQKEDTKALRAATIEECAREIERVALQHDTVVCAALAKHLRKMKKRGGR